MFWSSRAVGCLSFIATRDSVFLFQTTLLSSPAFAVSRFILLVFCESAGFVAPLPLILINTHLCRCRPRNNAFPLQALPSRYVFQVAWECMDLHGADHFLCRICADMPDCTLEVNMFRDDMSEKDKTATIAAHVASFNDHSKEYVQGLFDGTRGLNVRLVSYEKLWVLSTLEKCWRDSSVTHLDSRECLGGRWRREMEARQARKQASVDR